MDTKAHSRESTTARKMVWLCRGASAGAGPGTGWGHGADCAVLQCGQLSGFLHSAVGGHRYHQSPSNRSPQIGIGQTAPVEVLCQVQTGEEVPPRIAPLIFIGTSLTQLCGGSAGIGPGTAQRLHNLFSHFPLSSRQGQSRPSGRLCMNQLISEPGAEFVKMVNANGGKMPDAVGIPEEQLRQAARSAVCKIARPSHCGCTGRR